jgi:putative N6-adenine-specific DNA methylase
VEAETIKMIATTYEGLEDVLGRELMRMGAEDVDTDVCRVTFTGDKYLLYQANYELRTALKIYKEVLSFDFSSSEGFISQFTGYRWSKILNIYKSFRVEVSSKSTVLGTDAEIKDVLTKIILEYFNEKSKKTPPHDNSNPSVVIVIEVSAENNCKFMLDSSGDSLARRGYKVSNPSENVFDEVFSAGLVQLSGWKANTNFVDPLSRGGIMLIEAAMFAYNIPAQVCRESFGFFSWRDYDAEMWQDIKSSAKIRIKHNGEFAFKIIGYESDEHNVKAANQNVKKAILDKYIEIVRGDYSDIELPAGQTSTIIIAPKIDAFKKDETKDVSEMLSKLVKKTFKGAKTWIISDNPDMDKIIGVQHSKECEIKSGKNAYLLAQY